MRQILTLKYINQFYDKSFGYYISAVYDSSLYTGDCSEFNVDTEINTEIDSEINQNEDTDNLY